MTKKLTNSVDANEKLYQEFLEFFGNQVPDPNTYPRRYEFMVNVFLHHNKLNKNTKAHDDD